MGMPARLAIVLVGLLCLPLGARQAVSVGDPAQPALDLYLRQDYAGFEQLLQSAEPLDDHSFKAFQKVADVWVRGGEKNERRTFVAATVALEFAHRLRDKPSEWAAEFLVWASNLVGNRESDLRSDTERLWYLACLAGMTELSQPWDLSAGVESGTVRLRTLSRSIGPGGLLAVAQRRFPDEPRFKIAQLERDEWVHTRFEPVPDYVALVRHNVQLRPPVEVRSTEDVTQQSVIETAASAVQAMRASAQLREAFKALQLPNDFGPEILLHIGVLSMRSGSFTDSVRYLRAVEGASSDPYLLYLANHVEGRALYYLGARAEAAEAFDRSLAYFRNARSSATWLAALLSLSDAPADRDRAAELMSVAYRTGPAPDPWRFYGRSEAWRWSANIRQVQQSLK